MLQVIRLIVLAVNAIGNARRKNDLATFKNDEVPLQGQRTGFTRLPKSYFDENYPFQYFKQIFDEPLLSVEEYKTLLENVIIRSAGSKYSIYKTHRLSDKELVMNAGISYADLMYTGLAQKTNGVVTKFSYFVLVISELTNELEVRSCIYDDTNDKLKKMEFGKALIEHIAMLKNQS
ncbi:MAG: hypothetical protein EOP45_11415 [Sphingobacteriaceae bacterium]|nr:MAG: hypothetical protein EOP45_11415 [Sphingobacteriaceae bacterium]